MAEYIDANFPKPTLKRGWLFKEGGFIRSWKRRWFHLEGSILAYFTDEQESDPRGVIFLRDFEAVRGWTGVFPEL